MNPRRKQVEEKILDVVSRLTHKNEKNVNLYKELFSKMSDADFDEFMVGLKNGKYHLSIIVPLGNEVKITLENNQKVAKSLGYDFFQRLKINPNKEGEPSYITPNKYLVYKLPIKRTSQLLAKKISVPADNNSRDVLTGQVRGSSRARRVTGPEVQVLTGYGLVDSVIEFMKVRGGDLGSGAALDMMLFRTGEASLETAKQYGKGVRSSKTLKSYFEAMHIRNTL